MTIYLLEKLLRKRWLGAPICSSSKKGAIKLIGHGHGEYRIRKVVCGTAKRAAKSWIVARVIRP